MNETATATKTGKDGQEYFVNPETPLSAACDEYLESLAGIAKAKDDKDNAKKGLIEEMRKAHENTVVHQGREYTIREGHTTEEAIVIK